MRSSFWPLVAVSSEPVSASRAMTSSPTAIDRSGFTVTNTGLSGRGCGSTALAGSSTPRSTVASGAATMKMISSTSITSMNGVTLISCASTRSSSAARARPPNLAPSLEPMILLRSARDARRAAAALAADQQQHLRRGVTEQRAIGRDRTRQMIVDHDCRDCRDQAQRGRQQGFGNAGRDHGEICGVRLGDADEGVHDAPYRAEQSDERCGGADGREHAGAARDLPRHCRLDPFQPQRNALLDVVIENAAGETCLARGGLDDLRDGVAATLAVMFDIGQRGVALEQVEATLRPGGSRRSSMV